METDDEVALVERVHYKGFVVCDDKDTGVPSVRLFDLAVDGIHKVFKSKRLRKLAQEENPQACRGFKKRVVMILTPDGFRCDQSTKTVTGALFVEPLNKIVMCKIIE
eukprot:gene21527-35628_t